MLTRAAGVLHEVDQRIRALITLAHAICMEKGGSGCAQPR
jgi:hypothetical protein